MAGGEEQRAAAIALRDTFGKAADDISGKAADFHEITAESALQGARNLGDVDDQFGDTFNGIKPDDTADTPLTTGASPPGFHGTIKSILDPESVDEGSGASGDEFGDDATPQVPAASSTPDPSNPDTLRSTAPGGTKPAIFRGSSDPTALKQFFDDNYGDAVGRANPGRTASNHPEDFTNNCTRCGVATDSRLAGNEVSAMPTKGPQNLAAIEKTYGQSFHDVSGYDDIIDELRTAGPGSRGLIALTRNVGAGHVFNVVYDGNGVVFLDGQAPGLARLEPFKKLQFLKTN